MLVRLELCELHERLQLEEGELTTLLRSILQLRDQERAGWNAQLDEARAYARELEAELSRVRASSLPVVSGNGLGRSWSDSFSSTDVHFARSVSANLSGSFSSMELVRPVDTPQPWGPLSSPPGGVRGGAAPHRSPVAVDRPATNGQPDPHRKSTPWMPEEPFDYEDIAAKLAQRLASERSGLGGGSPGGGGGDVLRAEAYAGAVPTEVLSTPRAPSPSPAILAADGTPFQFTHLRL